MGLVSAALGVAANGVDVARDGTEQAACFVCSDGPRGGPRTYAGAATAAAASSGGSTGAAGAARAYLRRMADDFLEIVNLFPRAVDQVVNLAHQGTTAEMDRETSIDPSAVDPNQDRFTYEEAKWLEKGIIELMKKFGMKGTTPWVGPAIETFQVGEKIAGTIPAIRENREASRDALNQNSIERAKSNPGQDSDWP